MENSSNTTGNNDENRVSWLCQKPNGIILYYKRRDLSIASTTVLLLRGLEIVSPQGIIRHQIQPYKIRQCTYLHSIIFI